MKLRSLALLLFLFSVAGCDAVGSDDPATVTLRGLSLVYLPADLQAIVAAGGSVTWEVQDVIGRPYATEGSLPARVPNDKALLLVLADAATCTPRCEPAEIVPFRSPMQSNGSALQLVDLGVVADLSFE